MIRSAFLFFITLLFTVVGGCKVPQSRRQCSKFMESLTYTFQSAKTVGAGTVVPDSLVAEISNHSQCFIGQDSTKVVRLFANTRHYLLTPLFGEGNKKFGLKYSLTFPVTSGHNSSEILFGADSLNIVRAVRVLTGKTDKGIQ